MSIFLPNYINKIIIFLIILFIASCAETKDPSQNLLKIERFEKENKSGRKHHCYPFVEASYYPLTRCPKVQIEPRLPGQAHMEQWAPMVPKRERTQMSNTKRCISQKPECQKAYVYVSDSVRILPVGLFFFLGESRFPDKNIFERTA